MIFSKFQFGVILTIAALLTMLTVGCKRRTPSLPPQPTPAPEQVKSAPTIQFTANPEVINRGESATLSWTTTDATEVILKNIGKFSPHGSTTVTPTSSSTYTAIAYGPAGITRAQAQVTVLGGLDTTGQPDTSKVDEQPLTVEEIFKTQIKDVFYDFDRYDLTPESKANLRKNANVFATKISSVRILIEGHCDERGTAEYNIALGDKRANSARDYLISLGVAAGRIRTISYGEERPFDRRHNEEAWAKNRRAHFVLMR